MRPHHSAFAKALSCFFSLLVGSPAFTQSLVAAEPDTVTVPSSLSAVTVTGSREKTPLLQSPGAVGVISREEISQTGPMHPQQILGHIPGVAIAVTNGEGHTTAIRHPFTTSPLYLYLEDGIPIRATGFFNHNALYEVNIPQAGGVEIVKGPGSALYGSDAIGGTINILTRTPSSTPGASASGEMGSFGWRRLLLDGTTALGTDGAVRGAVNVTHTNGWRDQTAYDRKSLNLRSDQSMADGAVLKTILGYTEIDQETGANTALTYSDYLNNPTKNNLSIAYRKVEALRLSTEYEKNMGAALLSLTPYVRSNVMNLNGSYNLSSDPRIEKTNVASVGVLAKWRQDFSSPLKPRLIVGVDLERSPGSRTEDSIITTKDTSTSGANTYYTGYTSGSRIYDYEVTFKSAAVYAQAELSPTEALRLTAGARYDRIGYDMQNNLGSTTTQALSSTRYYGQTESASLNFAQISPKLGANLSLSPASSLYASYNHGFRAPSEGQLFRAGSTTEADALNKAQLALSLKPIKARQLEAGWRGSADGWSYDVSVYKLIKFDDLVSQRDLATNISTSVNAGQTQHHGIELALGKSLNSHWRLETALSYARHRYVDWVTSTADYSGNEMEAAPRLMANTRLSWKPQPGRLAELEWVRMSSYWLEASNSSTYGKYPGHDVLNVRLSQTVAKDSKLFARLMNLTDRRYADSASVSSSTPVFSPAMPRAVYVGLETAW